MRQDSFLFQFLRKPRQVAALAPSSRALAEAMVEQVPQRARRIAELGPGTGVFTRCLIDHGIAEQDLTLFEINPRFADLLAHRFPRAVLHRLPAQELAGVAGGPFDAVVSGLPLLSMTAAEQEAILDAAFARLAPDGAFIQFTYGPASPVRRGICGKLRLTFTRTRRIWANLPPATVYVFRRVRVPARILDMEPAADAWTTRCLEPT